MANNRFRRGSAVYRCRHCGKKTRETGSCESNNGLCASCYDSAGLENEHFDTGHETYVDGCPTCEQESKSKGVTNQ